MSKFSIFNFDTSIQKKLRPGGVECSLPGHKYKFSCTHSVKDGVNCSRQNKNQQR